MQIYMEGKWFQWYAPGKTWNILYNRRRPAAPRRCTSRTRRRRLSTTTRRTSPTRPPCLRAGYGEGDGCSAYGNRNFYNYFTDWFGSTQGTPAAAPPTLASANTSPFVLATSTDGTVWGYPLSRAECGARPCRSSTGIDRRLVGASHRRRERRRLTGTSSRSARTSACGLFSALGTRRSRPAPRWAWTGRGASWSPLPATSTATVSLTCSRRIRLAPCCCGAATTVGGSAHLVTVGSGWNSMNMLSGGFDFNGDGRPDLIGRDSGGRLTLFTGDGRGKWGGLRSDRNRLAEHDLDHEPRRLRRGCQA